MLASIPLVFFLVGVVISLLYNFYSLYSKYYKHPLSPFKLWRDKWQGSYRIGFNNIEEEYEQKELEVQGGFPEWLNGTLVRNGPGRFTCGSAWVTNWIDGLAVLHAFSFEKGKVFYTNKYLKTSNYWTVRDTGTFNYAGFAQDPCKSIFKSFFCLFVPSIAYPPQPPNANVNISKIAHDFVALTEVPLPVEFNLTTLATLGIVRYDDQLPENKAQQTVHPHYDPIKKEHLGFITQFGRQSYHTLYSLSDSSYTRQVLYSIKVKEPSYMHSFAVTENYAIMTLQPFTVNPLKLLLRLNAFIKNFVWKPNNKTRFVVINRYTGHLVDIYETEPFFTFHHVNAFEQDNEIVVDIIIYPDTQVIDQLNFNFILAGDAVKTPPGMGRLARFTINKKNKNVSKKYITTEHIELPRINYEKYNGREYTYVYSAGYRDPVSPYVFNKLVKINVTTGETLEWFADNCYPGEPIFVADSSICSSSLKEDAGVVLSIVLDAQREKSFLLVLDAQTFTELSRAEVDYPIPFGIHGTYLDAQHKGSL